MTQANNPILEGFYPDPSICAVGEDFYLVNSSFAYFPGVPIFHSKDLAHWVQIGNILERESQLPLKGCEHSQGIFAPTIRNHNGVFYMITTNVSGGGNFIVTANNPQGPWSDPYYLGSEAQGIDPSLFFDEDGKCYYVGTRPNQEGVRYNGNWEIWVQELSLETMKLTGESKKIWKGALKDVIWPEGPHLYKKDEYYYVMNAEGGTGPNHCITIARSKSIYGPFENNPNNPIITHRHLGKNYPIVYVGHGDLVEAPDGNWYMVMLASRPCKGYTNMGRETFLAKVIWEDGWPIVNPGIGKLEDVVEISLKEMTVIPQEPTYHFDVKSLEPTFVMLRNPKKDMYSLSERSGYLRLYLQMETLKEQESPSYISVRQQHYYYQVNTKLEFEGLYKNEVAGLAIVQNNKYHIRFEIFREKALQYVQLTVCTYGEDFQIAKKQISKGPVQLKIVNRGQEAAFYCKTESEWIMVAEKVDTHMLSTEVAGGFTGCTIGMYASSNGQSSKNYADFKWFSYADLK